MRLLSIDHAYSFSYQGTRWIDIDPRAITGIRAVRLHPHATHTAAVELTVAPHGYTEYLALPVPEANWKIITEIVNGSSLARSVTR